MELIQLGPEHWNHTFVVSEIINMEWVEIYTFPYQINAIATIKDLNATIKRPHKIGAA